MNLRELKYVILGDDKLSAKLRNITSASEKSAKSLGIHSKSLISIRSNFANLTEQVPALGSAMGMLTNPIGLTIAAVGLLAVGLNKSVEAAAQFNTTFRQLQNINLDKSKSQLDELRSGVLALSFTHGFDAEKTSTAMFDVQSLTGKFGPEVGQIVSKVGRFSQVMQSDFNQTIAGSTKAMVNFGFGINKIDEYLASSQKTVAVAKVSYDELSRVQTEFSGAAKSSFQSFDSANKLFSLFTVKAKSAEEAATLTKSAFTDLFKAPIVDSFKKIGMDLFDKKGLPKQIDQIIIELNSKFMEANKKGGARAMNAIKNEFMGSEGINSLMSVAMDTTGRTLQTLSSFNGAMTDFKKATALANEDLNLQNEIVGNKLKTSFIALGEVLMPIWLGFKKGIIWLLDGVAKVLASLGAPEMMVKLSMYEGLKTDEKPKSKEQVQSSYLEAFNKMSDKSLTPSQRTRWARKKDSLFAQLQDINKETPAPVGGSGTGGSGNLSSGLNGVAGGGSQVKNVTVIIQKMVEKLEVHAGSVRESSGEIKRIVEDTLLRSINGAEQVVGG